MQLAYHHSILVELMFLALHNMLCNSIISPDCHILFSVYRTPTLYRHEKHLLDQSTTSACCIVLFLYHRFELRIVHLASLLVLVYILACQILSRPPTWPRGRVEASLLNRQTVQAVQFLSQSQCAFDSSCPRKACELHRLQFDPSNRQHEENREASTTRNSEHFL